MTKNVTASVHGRLTNRAKKDGRPFRELLQYYGLERFLYRLAQTPHAERFVLKGALMLQVWQTPEKRPTRDIDLLGFVPSEIDLLESIARDICEVPVVDDGLRFDSTTVQGRRIKEDAEYEGVRVKLMGYLERSRIPIQVDVGFGDAVHPRPQESDYPTLLDFPAPRLRTYPRETVIAEKFSAMVERGSLNSRMKDFFDIWLLARTYDFQGAALAEAVRRTFTHRALLMDTNPIGLQSTFTASAKAQAQWVAFLKRSHLLEPATLAEITEPLRTFLLPVAEAVAAGDTFDATWTAPGPWG